MNQSNHILKYYAAFLMMFNLLACAGSNEGKAGNVRNTPKKVEESIEPLIAESIACHGKFKEDYEKFLNSCDLLTRVRYLGPQEMAYSLIYDIASQCDYLLRTYGEKDHGCEITTSSISGKTDYDITVSTCRLFYRAQERLDKGQ